MPAKRPAHKANIVIETCAEGHHVARYETGLYRFLLSDGQVIDVSAISDNSDLRDAVLQHFTSEMGNVTVEAVVRVEGDGHG